MNFERPVEDDDVIRLTSQDRQGDIFALVDAIGSRDGQEALKMLHLLLQDDDPQQIFGMVVRQFRLLVQAREVLAQGGVEADVVQALKIHPFVGHKITLQAQRFSLSALEAIYQSLVQIDVGGKTGGMPVDLALDVLIAKLAG